MLNSYRSNSTEKLSNKDCTCDLNGKIESDSLFNLQKSLTEMNSLVPEENQNIENVDNTNKTSTPKLPLINISRARTRNIPTNFLTEKPQIPISLRYNYSENRLKIRNYDIDEYVP